MDELVTPLFASEKPEPGGLFHNKEIVEITGLSGNRLREYQRDRLVQVRGTLKNTWNLSSRSDIAVFVVASELRDAMDAHYRVQQAAAISMYGWKVPEQESLPYHPITHALYGAASGEGFWVLRVRFLKNDQDGQRFISSFCYDDNNPPRIRRDVKDPFLEVGSLTLMLQPLLLPLARAFKNYANRDARIEP